MRRNERKIALLYDHFTTVLFSRSSCPFLTCYRKKQSSSEAPVRLHNSVGFDGSCRQAGPRLYRFEVANPSLS